MSVIVDAAGLSTANVGEMSEETPARRPRKFALTDKQIVDGTSHSWTLGGGIAGKGHVRHATRIDPTGNQQINAVIKGPQYDTTRPVARFREELSGMREFSAHRTAGVLPILDWQENATELWYVMPSAIPLADHLDGVDFDDVVRTIVTLADTLDALSRPSRADTGPGAVAHRDLKPENLFWYDGGPVLADFGIAAWFVEHPAQTLTPEGSKLGPLFYMAPEARYYTASVDWHRADIYSLAMTFWSLAAKRRTSGTGKTTVELPPSGSILASDDRYSLARFGGRDAGMLDALMEQATNVSPGDRPTAAGFRDELLTWLSMYPGPHPRPEHFFLTGIEPIRRIIVRMELDQNQFLDVLRSESRKELGKVEFDESVTVDYKPREEMDEDGLPRGDAIMDASKHGRGEHDEWDGSFVVALRSSDNAMRLVIGGTFDTPGRVDWIAESHERKDGSWELVDSTEETGLVIGLLTTRKIIREFLQAHKPAPDTFETELSWVAERVL